MSSTTSTAWMDAQAEFHGLLVKLIAEARAELGDDRPVVLDI